MLITRDMVKIKIKATKETDSIKFAANGCAPGFAEAVKSIKDKSPLWGWCSVTVTATLLEGPLFISGEAHLGHCSYMSKKDFIENSGYYDQMVDDAIFELVENLKDGCKHMSNMLMIWNFNHKIKETRLEFERLAEELTY